MTRRTRPSAYPFLASALLVSALSVFPVIVPGAGSAQGMVPNLEGMVIPGIELPTEAMPERAPTGPVTRGVTTMTPPRTGEATPTLGETIARAQACDAMIARAFLTEKEKITCRKDKDIYREGATKAVEALTPLYTEHLEAQRAMLSAFGTSAIRELPIIAPGDLTRIVAETPNEISLYEGTQILLDDVVFVNWGEVGRRDRGYELWTRTVPAGPTGAIGTASKPPSGMATAPGRGSMGPGSNTVSVFYLSPSFGQSARDISEACLQFSFTQTPCSGAAEVSARTFEDTYYPEIRSVDFDPFTEAQTHGGLTRLLADPWGAEEVSERTARMAAMPAAITSLIETP